jgi:hypothetical protein
MSNTSNDTLMPADDRRRRGRIVPLILFLLALVYGGLAVPWALRAFGPAPDADEQAEAFSLAGPIAETIEAAQATTDTPDIDLYADLVSPLFADEDTLAYIRVWDPRGRLAFEVTRDLTVPRAGNAARLPALGIDAALEPLRAQVKDARWVETIGQLQALEQDQGDITALFDAMADPPTTAQRNHVLVVQDNTLKLTESLREIGLPVADAAADMQRVLDALTGPEPDAATARSASEDVESDLTLALTGKRARQDTVATLPAWLAKAEPGPHWPFLRGRRVVMPLFVPAATDELIAVSGYAEIVVFTRPLSAMLTLAAIPAILLLLAALLTALAGRPRGEKKKKFRPVYDDTGGEW